jgi:hypothetical protein
MKKLGWMAAAALVTLAVPAAAQDFDPMQFADTNADGKVTLEEYTSFEAQAWNYITQGADKVKAADLPAGMQPVVAGVTPDAGGYVTQAAFTSSVPDRFKAADTDGDGTLSGAELRASLGQAAH